MAATHDVRKILAVSSEMIIFAGVFQNRIVCMGQLAFLKTYILVAMSLDANDNRRHVHVFHKGHRHLKSVAKIWIESNGKKCIEIDESTLSAKENKMIMDAIDRHWEYINEQITITFRGEKTRPINIENSIDRRLLTCVRFQM